MDRLTDLVCPDLDIVDLGVQLPKLGSSYIGLQGSAVACRESGSGLYRSFKAEHTSILTVSRLYAVLLPLLRPLPLLGVRWVPLTLLLLAFDLPICSSSDLLYSMSVGQRGVHGHV